MTKLLAALLAVLTGVISSVPPYAGHWTLDAQQSTGLPPYYSQVKSHVLDVTQGEGMLGVVVLIDLGGAAPDTMRFAYQLDGKAVRTQTPIRGPGGIRLVPTTLEATLREDGSVHAVITREITMGAETFRPVTTEDWTLSPDGQFLTVHRVDAGPRPVDAQMVFRRG